MVVCKFFQQGYCRYGQNCKFEHVYGTKYNYHSTTSSTTNQHQHAPAQTGVTDEQLVRQVQVDMQSALSGGQWILSSYAPFTMKPVFPGISDLSPEEARLFIYEAKYTNNLDQAIAYMNSVTKENRQKYEQLLNATPAIVKALRSIYNGETVPTPFSNNTQTSNSASSIFRSAAQNPAAFGQTNTPFGTSSFPPDPAKSLFATANNFPQSAESAKSLFAQASQNVFGQSQSPSQPIFGAETTAAKSIFAQASQSVFGGSPQTQSASNIFATTNQNFAPSVFNQNSSPFGNQDQTKSDPFKQTPFSNNSVFQTQNTSSFSTNTFQQSTDDAGLYSEINDLSTDDLEAFKCEDFKLGFIPEVPPPKSLCF